MEFEWNKTKNAINKTKHGVTFEEAKTVFYDPDALVIADIKHSSEEDRFIILGISEAIRMLVVCHCYKNGDTIRIISARKATKTESQQYKDRRI